MLVTRWHTEEKGRKIQVWSFYQVVSLRYFHMTSSTQLDWSAGCIRWAVPAEHSLWPQPRLHSGWCSALCQRTCWFALWWQGSWRPRPQSPLHRYLPFSALKTESRRRGWHKTGLFKFTDTSSLSNTDQKHHVCWNSCVNSTAVFTHVCIKGHPGYFPFKAKSFCERTLLNHT